MNTRVLTGKRIRPFFGTVFIGVARHILSFFRKNIVMTVALVASCVTMMFVPVDAEYIGYFDLKTLTCLFAVLAVVCSLKNIRFFYTMAEKIVKCFGTARKSVLALVYITFIGSMLIANDMAF